MEPLKGDWNIGENHKELVKPILDCNLECLLGGTEYADLIDDVQMLCDRIARPLLRDEAPTWDPTDTFRKVQERFGVDDDPDILQVSLYLVMLQIVFDFHKEK